MPRPLHALPTGHECRRATRVGEQRAYLVGGAGAVEDDEESLAGRPAAKQCGAVVGDLGIRHAERAQHAGECLRGFCGCDSGGAAVQIDEQLAVGKPGGEQVPGVHG